MKNLIFLIIIFPIAAFTQNTTSISGYVKDKVENPIQDVNVIIEGTQLGAITDSLGYYKIENIKPSSYNITASSLGFESQTIFNAVIKSVGNQEYNFF